jgi:hypothetical protein
MHNLIAAFAICSLQVLGLIGSMDLNWPPLFAKLIAIAQFNWLQFPWVQPECILTPTTFVIWMLAYSQGLLILVVLLALFYAGSSSARFDKVGSTSQIVCCICCGVGALLGSMRRLLRSKVLKLVNENESMHTRIHPDESDARAALFCVFTILFSATLRNSFMLGVHMGLTRSRDAAYYAFAILIALALLSATLFLMCYFRRLYEHEPLPILTMRFRGDLQEDTDGVRRFYMRPSLWQFVVWYRQLALFVISASLQLCQWCVPFCLCQMLFSLSDRAQQPRV